jgi:hypothetical protein
MLAKILLAEFSLSFLFQLSLFLSFSFSLVDFLWDGPFDISIKLMGELAKVKKLFIF